MPVNFLYSSLYLNSILSKFSVKNRLFNRLLSNSTIWNVHFRLLNLFRDISWEKFKKLLADSTSIYKRGSAHFFKSLKKREIRNATTLSLTRFRTNQKTKKTFQQNMNNSDLSSRLIQAQFHISHYNDSSILKTITHYVVFDKCNENLPYQKPFLREPG